MISRSSGTLSLVGSSKGVARCMNNKRAVVGRVRILEQKTSELRRQADNNVGLENDDSLWLSSLEIIGELLNVMQQVVEGWDEISDKMQVACPSCRSLVAVSYETIADAAITCPACGDAFLLANPT